MIKNIRVDQAPKKQTPHDASVRLLHDTEHVQIMHIKIAPGKALRKHLTPVDAAFFILEGEATVQIGEDIEKFGPNTLVDSPAKIPHRVSNEGTEPLSFLVLKTPRPTEKSQVL